MDSNYNLKTLKKFNKLKAILRKYPGVVVSFSGGVDSSLLLKIASDVLRKRVVAVTLVSPLYTDEEVAVAKKTAKKLKCKHIIINSDELKNKKFVSNPKNRCYYCKMELFKKLKKIASQYDYYVIEGSNKSDLRDCRPGFKAIRELGIKSPLIQAKVGKEEIRVLAKQLQLPNWNRPSMACLASRIPYGRVVDKKTLQMIESAERYLKKLKLTQVRVRHHFPIARIEVEENEFKIIIKYRKKIIKYFQKLGYKYITLDVQGYQSGSLNR